MKSRNYASVFCVLAFILSITPVFASTTTDSANPVISSISPQTGKEGDTITIKGKNFSSLNPDLEVRRYVNFNGFLGTEIVDWQPSAIKVKVPLIGATEQERQKTAIDVVSKLPLFGKFGKYLFEFMPVQVAKAPTEEGVPVSVSVVVPSGESNIVDFTYINETSDKKTNPIVDDAKLLLSIAWQNEVVDPITHLLHPIKSFKETTQRLGRVIAYSSVQTAHAPSIEQSGTTKKDNCDFSHYQIKYNEPQPTLKAIRDKITSLNIGRYSAMNSDSRTIIEIRGNEKDGSLTKAELGKLNKGLAELGIFEPQVFSSLSTINGVCRSQNDIIINKKDIEKLWGGTGQKQENVAVQSLKTSLTKSGKITAYITDQYGNAYLGKDFGGNWTSNVSFQFTIRDALGEKAGHVTVKEGRLESDDVLPSGQYAIEPIPSSFSDGMTPVVIKTFTLPSEGINLGTLIINKWGLVKVKVVNEVGTTLGDAYSRIVKCEITDEYVKEQPHNICWSALNAAFFDPSYYPAGNYTIKISRYDYESVEKSFSVNNRDVDLGTIVLKKK